MNGSLAPTVARLLAVMVLIGCAVAAIALGRDASQSSNETATPIVRPPVLLPPAPEPVAPRPLPRIELGAMLRALSTGPAAPIRRLGLVDPDALCASTFERADWTADAASRSGTGDGAQVECSGERRYEAAVEARSEERARPTTSFAILRTRGRALREMRIKVNLHDEAARNEAARDAAGLVSDLLTGLRWGDVGRELTEAAGVLRTVDQSRSGVRWRVWREPGGEIARYNILVTVAPTPFEEPADRLGPNGPEQAAAFERIENLR